MQEQSSWQQTKSKQSFNEALQYKLKSLPEQLSSLVAVLSLYVIHESFFSALIIIMIQQGVMIHMFAWQVVYRDLVPDIHKTWRIT